MALNWDFKSDFVGTAHYNDGGVDKVVNLYTGNALLIALTEDTEKRYCLQWFLADDVHLKNWIANDEYGFWKSVRFQFDVYGLSKGDLHKVKQVVKLLLGISWIDLCPHEVKTKAYWNEEKQDFEYQIIGNKEV